ncbi:MAG: Gfo/Idh/MocA family oxidoreductase [Clostridiaceae bacterium]|nr:Gfo/Idh/MocA family oxidoreductase [Clostridiaceae bacterium]
MTADRTDKSQETDSPLRVALVGCGKVARKHIQALRYHHRRAVLTALVDTRPAAAAALLRSCGFTAAEASAVPVFADTAEMLTRVKPDLVAITTPSGTHYAIAMAALRAGAHVLVEKPLTLNLTEAEILLKTAAEQNLKVAVGHIYRFFPVVRSLAADLREGRFGRVLYGDVKVRWGHDQAYYDQAAWRGSWSQDGGALMNQSIHALDLMIWLLGGRAVEACGWIDRQTHRMEAEDFGLAMLKLDNDAYCLIEGTTNTDPKRPEASFTVQCTGGEIRAGIVKGKPSIRIRDRDGRKLGGRYLRRFLLAEWRRGGLGALLQLKNPHSGLYGDLIAAIRENRAPLADGGAGLAAVEMVLAIYQSARLKRTVTLPVDDFSLADMRGFFPEP